MPYRHTFRSVSSGTTHVSNSATFDDHDGQGNVIGQRSFSGSASCSISNTSTRISMSVSGSTNGRSIFVQGRGNLPTTVTFSPPSSGSDLTGTTRSYSATVIVAAYEDVWIGSRTFTVGSLSCSAVIDSEWYDPPPTYYYAYLNYDANGGSGAPSNDSYRTTSSSGSHTFTISSTIPTMTDKVFAGWATSSGASTAQYQPGDSITVDIGDSVTLYAVWADAPKYRIFVRTTSWQEAEKVYVNVGGSWREAKVISVNTGSWHDSQ